MYTVVTAVACSVYGALYMAVFRRRGRMAELEIMYWFGDVLLPPCITIPVCNMPEGPNARHVVMLALFPVFFHALYAGIILTITRSLEASVKALRAAPLLGVIHTPLHEMLDEESSGLETSDDDEP